MHERGCGGVISHGIPYGLRRRRARSRGAGRSSRPPCARATRRITVDRQAGDRRVPHVVGRESRAARAGQNLTTTPGWRACSRSVPRIDYDKQQGEDRERGRTSEQELRKRIGSSSLVGQATVVPGVRTV